MCPFYTPDWNVFIKHQVEETGDQKFCPEVIGSGVMQIELNLYRIETGISVTVMRRKIAGC